MRRLALPAASAIAIAVAVARAAPSTRPAAAAAPQAPVRAPETRPAARAGAYHAYWLTKPGDGNGGDADLLVVMGGYADLLVSKVPIERLTSETLPDASATVFATYPRHSGGRPDRNPVRTPRSAKVADADKATVELDGSEFHYAQASVRDVVALLGRAYPTQPVHRVLPPLAGADEAAKEALLLRLTVQIAAEDEDGPRQVPFDTHDGYVVSDRFEPDAPASFVVLRDQKAFDAVFTPADPAKDGHRRLPADAFDSKVVVAVIRRGAAVPAYKVEDVTAYGAGGALIVRYATAAAPEPHPPAGSAAAPLIVSVPRRDYADVRFGEDGKLVKKVELDGVKPANATGAFLGPAGEWFGCAVELADVHALWGRGTAVHLRASGEVAVRVVENRAERRFNVTLSAHETAAVRRLCVDADLLAAPVKDRAGVPDEGRAVISLVNAAGQRREVSKWDGDKVGAFDRVYQGLLGLRKKTEHLKPEYEGPYQPNWKPAPAFEIKCRKPEDAVRVSTEGGRVVLDVTSPSGIGGATVERTGGQWPDGVVLRVRLKGLESLRVAGGDAALRVSVLSHSGHPRLLRLARGGEREGPELAKGDPGWTDVRAVDGKGMPTDGLPGEGGWFELAVPKAVLADDPKTLTLDWIDFYRR